MECIMDMAPGMDFRSNLEKAIRNLADALGEGMIVKHKKFGEGVVVDMEGEHIRIQFGDNVKNMDLKVLARLEMLEI